MAPPRRLPVLQNSAEDDDRRPRWHWVPIGVVFALSLWLPAAMLTSWFGRQASMRLLASSAPGDPAEQIARAEPWQRALLQVLLLGIPLFGFAVSVAAAGTLCGRFGARVRPRDAALAGSIAALTAAMLAGASHARAAGAALLFLLPIGAFAGYAGGSLGVRLRRAVGTRSAPPPG